MTDNDTRRCSDCDGQMTEIRLIDKAHGLSAQEVEYGSLGAKPSFWTGRVPIMGKVRAFMCSECGLIKQYGVPE
jgi:hypothetical protein